MKLIYLEWEDAVTYNTGWHTKEEVAEWESDATWISKQAGWLMNETKKYITIAWAMEPGSDGHEKMYTCLQKIPKTWIRRRVDLTKFLSGVADGEGEAV